MPLVIRDVLEGNEAFLIHELAKQYVQQFDAKARKLGLTRTQWFLLRTLYRHPGIRQTDLADKLEIAPMSLVHLLDRMEKKKWCRRVTDAKDRRVKRVYLDAKMDGYSAKMRTLAIALRKSALVDFSAQEHAELYAFLQRMRANLNANDTKIIPIKSNESKQPKLKNGRSSR